MRVAAIFQLQQALPSYITDTGLLTDELSSTLIGASAGFLLNGNNNVDISQPLNERILPDVTSGDATYSYTVDYEALQGVRGALTQAISALAAYDTVTEDREKVMVQRGELYALEGYDEILLADFFCSGVPLSTFDFGKNYTYHASSTKEAVYQDAIAKEDSAITLADTSSQVLNLALVLKGRALLDLGGQYAQQAAQVVATVPDQFQYSLFLQWTNHYNFCNFLNGCAGPLATVSDGEGGTGLPYVSDGDLRTAVTAQGTSQTGATLYFPNKYTLGSFSPMPAADWIEARLIEAEVALQGKDYITWLAKLNHVRAVAMVSGQSTALADPGTDSARVSLTFRERAYWFFLTGHRQGDLRRLIRQYNRQQFQVYPTGKYTAPGTGLYGTDVTAPIPSAEYLNPKFHGCIDRKA